jgi:PRTRC genetic system ThiF family protein
MKHYAPAHFINPLHKILVKIVGTGGTGSQVLTSLARINSTLIALGHPGLHVTVVDHDTVSESNLGRQLFSPSDLGRFKGDVLIERINRFFGLNWESNNHWFDGVEGANILISCVDNMSGRNEIRRQFEYNVNRNDDKKYNSLYYWMDFGNSNSSGQVVLASTYINQPFKEDTCFRLKSVFDLFPNFGADEPDDDTPSCSVAQAIKKQDLFTNSILAQLGCDILWKLLKDKVIEHHGVFMNLETMNVKPIKIL